MKQILFLLATACAVSLHIPSAADTGTLKVTADQSQQDAKQPHGSRGKDSGWSGTKQPKSETETTKGGKADR